MMGLRVPAPPPGAFPPAERPAARARVRAVAGLAVLASVAYLTWRVLGTVDLDVWWIAVPLVLLEAQVVLGLMLHTAGLWDLDAVRPPEPVDEADLSLAILIPTCDEPAEVLIPTIAAAVAVRLPHSTWVLDDGGRTEIAELATTLGAHYLAREEHAHGRAGNVNHALGHVDADVVAVLDADHVASPDLFRHTLGHFADPAVAVVQTPQDFYNVDSFEHSGTRWTAEGAAYRYSEQALFHRAVQPGRNRWGAAFSCGTGALFRLRALRSVGGLATETVTEDLHTSIRLHRRGWRSVHHNEVLARGLAATDARQYLEQRLRSGTGAMQVLRTENPALVGGLSPMQRLSYLTTLLSWFDSWRTLGYLLAPMVVVLTGAVPVDARLSEFLTWFVPALVLQQLARRALSRGLAPRGMSAVFALVRLPADLTATLCLASGRPPGFRAVPSRTRTGESRARTPLPRLLAALLVMTVVCAGWFAATAAGLTPVRYEVPWTAYGAALWLGVNGVLLALAARRIRLERYGVERRGAVRFPVVGPVAVDGRIGWLHDAAVTGFRVAVPAARAPQVGTCAQVVVATDEGPLRVDVVVRSSLKRRTDDGADLRLLGVQVAPDQISEQARLALALFAGGQATSAQPALARGADRMPTPPAVASQG